MERRGFLSTAGDWLWFLAFAAASSAWCLTAAAEIGATFDEPIYVERGLQGWRSGSHSGLIRLGTMPLPPDLDTLPLYLWERWHGVTFDPVRDLAEVLPWARACTLLFWWLLLFYARLAGRSLAGPWGGRLAVALIACEPSFLAHAGLATTDLAITACILAFVYHFRTGREAGWFRRVGLPTFWFGACLLAKASGLVYGPVCMLVVEAERLARRARRGGRGAVGWALPTGGDPGGQCPPYSPTPPSPPPARLGQRVAAAWAAFRPLRRDGVRIFLGGLLLTFIYCGCDWKPQPSFVEWAHKLPEGPFASVMVWLAENLRIFSNAGEGIVRQIKHNLHGHGAYLLGHADPRSFWYYFPVLLTIKLSVPLLLAPLVLAALRPRSLLNWALLTAAVLLVLSLRFRVQIGVRLVLPLVALAAVGLGAAAAETYRNLGPGLRRRLLAGAVAAGLLWTAGAAVRVWPHGVCYANELWGGTAGAYPYISDANYDWGQGLPDLARWQRRQGIPRMTVWYFGTDPSYDPQALRVLPLHILPLKGPQDVVAQVRGQYLAVSTTLLYGPPMDLEGHRQAIRMLRALRPVGRTPTFFIFDFTREGEASARAAR
jgi:hypothetical protein